MITDADIAAKKAALLRSIEADYTSMIDTGTLDRFGLKSLKKSINHTLKVAKALPKTAGRISRLVITHPRQGIKEIVKVHKNIIDDQFTAAKKGAPIALGAAAIYFGGPYIATAIANGTIPGIASTALKTGALTLEAQKLIFMRKAAEHPEEAAALQGQPPDVVLQSPLVQDAANEVLRAQQAQQGINIESPEANDLLKAQTQQTAETIAANSTNSTNSEKGGIMSSIAVALPITALLLG